MVESSIDYRSLIITASVIALIYLVMRGQEKARGREIEFMERWQDFGEVVYKQLHR